MKSPRSIAIAAAIWLLAAAAAAAETPAKRIVLIAGEVHQGPGGHPKGTHEYVRSARLLEHCLETAPGLGSIRAEVHLGGWPEDPEALERADAIVLISDGSDRRREDHPFLAGDRLAVIERQMRRGCGLVFQTVLGHAAESIRAPGAAALIRRGCIWAAGRPLWSER